MTGGGRHIAPSTLATGVLGEGSPHERPDGALVLVRLVIASPRRLLRAGFLGAGERLDATVDSVASDDGYKGGRWGVIWKYHIIARVSPQKQVAAQAMVPATRCG